MNIFGIILCGGGGTRLGGINKAALRIGGLSCLQHVHKRVGAQCTALALVGTNNDSTDPAMTRLPDRFDPPIGPLGGIYSGALWASGQTDEVEKSWIMTAPVDGPLFPRDFVARAFESQPPQHPIIGRYGANLYPVCGLWPLADALNIPALHAKQRGNAIHSILAILQAQEIDFEHFYAHNPFENANTIPDLLQLSRQMEAATDPE